MMMNGITMATATVTAPSSKKYIATGGKTAYTIKFGDSIGEEATERTGKSRCGTE